MNEIPNIRKNKVPVSRNPVPPPPNKNKQSTKAMPEKKSVYILTYGPGTLYSVTMGIYETIEGAYQRLERATFLKDVLPKLSEVKEDIERKDSYSTAFVQLQRWFLEP